MARLLLVGFVVLAFAAIGAGRALAEGESELWRADRALREHDAAAAIVHARAAAEWYLPGAVHVDLAYARLAHVARTSEAFADKPTALLAWRAVRSAALSTRWLRQPHAGDLAAADEAIARLESEISPPPVVGDEGAAGEARRRALAGLTEGERGHAAQTLTLLAGLCAELVAAIWGARRAAALFPSDEAATLGAADRRRAAPMARGAYAALAGPAAVAAAGLVAVAVAAYAS